MPLTITPLISGLCRMIFFFNMEKEAASEISDAKEEPLNILTCIFQVHSHADIGL